jgi:murein DD-endopeptidase MepM/ murein hydrolase activator NlpD
MRVLHLSKASIIGWYKAGEVIGYSGNTGDSSGAHLHVDVWNTPIDSALIGTKAGVYKYLLDPLQFINNLF